MCITKVTAFEHAGKLFSTEEEALKAALSTAQVDETERLRIRALRAAEQFIVNGIEMGYIQMPEPSTPDSAHDTLPLIRAALAPEGDAR